MQMIATQKYADLIFIGNFTKVFELLEAETTDRLIYLLKEDRIFGKQKPERSKRQNNTSTFQFLKNFWYGYILNSKHAEAFINSEYRQLALFFIHVQLPENWFIKTISTKYPKSTLAALRVSRHFLFPGFLSTLDFWNNSPDAYLNNHYAAFKALQEKEERLWLDATNKTSTAELNLSQWLYIIFLHHGWHQRKKEEKTFEMPDHFIPGYTSHKAYGVFISYLFSQQVKMPTGKTEMIRSIGFLMKDTDYLKSVMQVIDSWVTWYSFVYTELELYCYSLNYEVRKEDTGQLVLFPSDPYRQSLRFAAEIRQGMFFARLRNYADKSTRRDLKRVGAFMRDGEHTLAALMELSFKIVPFTLNYNTAGVYSTIFCLAPEEEQKLSDLNAILGTMQSEVQQQYILPLRDLTATNVEDWLTEVHHLIGEIINRTELSSNPLPLFQLTESSMVSAITKAGIKTVNYTDLAGLLIYDPEIKKRPFNRFNPFFDFYETPFIQSGLVITGIKSLFGLQDTGILALETYMKSSGNRGLTQHGETKMFEEQVAQLLEEAGFLVYRNLSIRESDNSEAGEIDLLLVEEGDCMVVEIKRSRLPLTPFERFQEEEHLISHASEQVERAITKLKTGEKGILRDSKNRNESLGGVPDLTGIRSFMGCIISMYCFRDSELIAEGVVKTSFVEFEMSEILQNCKEIQKDKIKTFYELSSKPFIPAEFLKNSKIRQEIIV